MTSPNLHAPNLRALIVHAHPGPTSFSTAQAQLASETLKNDGYEVEFVDLYERQWNPVLARSEFPPFEGPFKPQHEQSKALRTKTLRDDVRGDLDLVLGADLLVLSFPLWWFSVPAILKGWLDRVFVMGGVAGGEAGLFESARLAGRKAMVLTSTGGPAAAFETDGRFGDMDHFLFHIHRGVFEFVGYQPLKPIVTFGPAHLTESERANALGNVARALRDLDRRARVSIKARGR